MGEREEAREAGLPLNPRGEMKRLTKRKAKEETDEEETEKRKWQHTAAA